MTGIGMNEVSKRIEAVDPRINFFHFQMCSDNHSSKPFLGQRSELIWSFYVWKLKKKTNKEKIKWQKILL